MHENEHRRDVRFWLAGLTIAAVAVVISVLADLYTRPTGLRFDEKYYFTLAKSIAGGTYDDGYLIRPPLYPLFLGAMIRVFGTGFTPILVVQSLVRGSLVAQVIYMGRKYASAATGILAGGLLAIYPLLIWNYTRFLNEVLYLPLFLFSFYMVERSVRTERPADAFTAGIASGLASLVRATSFFLTFVIAIWFVVRRSKSGRFSRRNLASALLLVVALLIAVSPWTIRNAVVHKAFMPMGNEAAYNLWFIVSGVTLSEATDQWLSWGTQVERQKEALRRWRDYVVKNPTFHIKRLINRLPRIFDPEEQRPARGIALITHGVGSRRHGVLGPIVDVLTPAVFLVLMVGGLIGLAALKDAPHRRGLTLLTVLYFILLYAPTIMKSRYFLPVVCLLAIYAARLIAAGLARLQRSP
jgi:hypothetical protein